MTAPICPYCERKSKLVNSSVIYGRDYGWAYLCKPCDAYVGCHKGTKKSKGSLANAELREVRKQTHALFDPVWRNKLLSRSDAYSWLAKLLNIPKSECHIGMFNVEMCQSAITVIKAERPKLELKLLTQRSR